MAGRDGQQHWRGQGEGRGRGQEQGRGRQQHGQGERGVQQRQDRQTGGQRENLPQRGVGKPRGGQGRGQGLEATNLATNDTMLQNPRQNMQTPLPTPPPTLGNSKISWANIVAQSAPPTPTSPASITPKKDKDVATSSMSGTTAPHSIRSEDETIDPSYVLPRLSTNEPSTTSHNDNEATSWLEYVKILCQNVLRVSRGNDASYDQQCKDISNDLNIYQGYSHGRKAIFPARPQSLPNGEDFPGVTITKVSANHFKMNLPSFSEISQPDLPSTSANSQTQFYLYSVVWPSESQGKKFMKLLKKEWWDEIVTIYGNDPKGMNKIHHIYDGGTMMISNEPFAWKEGQIKEGVTLPNGHNGEKSVFIKFIETLNWESCRKFLSNDIEERNVFPKDAIRVLNMVMKEYCVRKGYFESGRYYFDKGNRGKRLGNQDLLISRSGYFQSVRALQGGLTLNVDVMTAAFYKPDMPLTTAWELLRRNFLPEAQRRSFDQWSDQSTWNEEQVGITNEYWKKLKIVSFHRSALMNESKLKKDFTICQFEETCADNTHVEGLYNMPFSGNLCQFMAERYRLNRYDLCGNMPAIKLNKKEHYLPWGCCKTTFESRYANKLEDSQLLKALERDPMRRCGDLLVWMQNRYRSDQDPDSYLATAENMFKISVEPTMMTIDAIKLPKPNMEARGAQILQWSGDESNKANPNLNPTFNFTSSQKVLVPGEVFPWGILSFDRENGVWENHFLEALHRKANDLGIHWPDKNPTFWHTVTRDHNHQYSNKDRQRMVKDDVRRLLGMGMRLNLIICFMARKMNPEYVTLKAECDIVHGVPIQVVLTKGDPKRINMLLMSMLLKINVKCGGVNFRVSQQGSIQGKTGCLNDISLTKENQSKKTILFGADVTHPSGMHSIAAVVATTNSTFLNYATRIQSQTPGEEIIQSLKEMVKDLLQVYLEDEGCLPDQILFFRDGVGETTYLDVLRYEGVRILEAAKELADYKPQLTIIIAVKRHHTRFFKKSQQGSGQESWTNMSHGTVVDTGVTHPKDYDFFLCSQAALKGTSRATHYYVLLDQINLSRGDLYRLIYYLAHTYQRCTKSVSIVTPVYYAHLAAFRAKQYMESFLLEHRDQNQNYELNAHPNLWNRLWYL